MVNVASTAERYNQPIDLPLWIEPQLLRSARGIYHSFRVLHPKQDRRPQGVAIHRDTHRGQLIFRDQPILLPGECFVPTDHLEAELS